MKIKIITLALMLSLTPALANAKTHGSANHGLRHIHVARYYKGTVTIYKK